MGITEITTKNISTIVSKFLWRNQLSIMSIYSIIWQDKIPVAIASSTVDRSHLKVYYKIVWEQL